MAVGAIMQPATTAEKPNPTCSINGIRKGTQPVPRRDAILPIMPTEKVRVLNSGRLISGAGWRRA